jgi:hypothetical protein
MRSKTEIRGLRSKADREKLDKKWFSLRELLIPDVGEALYRVQRVYVDIQRTGPDPLNTWILYARPTVTVETRLGAALYRLPMELIGWAFLEYCKQAVGATRRFPAVVGFLRRGDSYSITSHVVTPEKKLPSPGTLA